MDEDTPPSFRLMLTLRRAGVSDPRVLAAFEACPRNRFIAPQLEDLAWEDVAAPLPCGQSVLRPSSLALMLDALGAGEGHRVLLIGAGSGFSSAILARLAERVFAVDRYHTLCALASANLARDGMTNINVAQADGFGGLEAQAPFDRILSTGAFSSIPRALLAQLAPQGVLVAPIINASVRDGACTILQCRSQSDGRMSEISMSGVSADPLEPGLALEL